MKLDSLPWWRTDDYTSEAMIPATLNEKAGPLGPALVKVFPDGRTQTGWGAEAFIDEYLKKAFIPERSAWGFRKKGQPFAFVMRSFRVVAVDIDGKNGGFEGALRLGNLPRTLAETSKSGNGYHLFYSVEEEWDLSAGFGRFSDHIGIEVGVDIRATGCIYHHNTQRWNTSDIVPLPQYLVDMFDARKNRRRGMPMRIEAARQQGDEYEMLMIQDELMDEIKKPIPAGKRNNTLFAIGTKLVLAGVQDWEIVLMGRAMQLGLDEPEATKLCENITRYASK